MEKHPILFGAGCFLAGFIAGGGSATVFYEKTGRLVKVTKTATPAK